MIRTDSEDDGVVRRQFPPPPALVVIGDINPYPERGKPQVEDGDDTATEEDASSRPTLPFIKKD